MSSRLPAGLSVAAVLMGVAVGAQSPAEWQDVIRSLRRPEADARLRAIDRLERADYAPAAEAMAPLVVDPVDQVQSAAIDAELTFYLTDKISVIRVLGVGGSKSRAQEAFDAGPLVRTAAPAPPVLIDKLIAAMRDDNARVRFDAVHALGFIAESPLPEPQALALADGLEHYEPVMRTATARALGRLRAKEAGERLLAAMSDSNASVRQYAIESLGLVREARALSLLRSIVIRRAEFAPEALLALARIGAADDRAMFRDRLADRSPIVRRAAVEGLGRIGDRSSKEAIAQMVKADGAPEVQLAAMFALDRLGEVQTHLIASRLGARDVGAQARDYLFEIGHDAVPGIRSALDVITDSRQRADLAQLVGYVGTAADIPVLQPLLADRDERVVRAATNAVLRLKR